MCTYNSLLVSCLFTTLALAIPFSRVPSEVAFDSSEAIPADSIEMSTMLLSRSDAQIDTTGTIVQTTAKRALPGPQALAAVYAKYNKSLTQEQSAAAQNSRFSISIKASVATTPGPNDAEYLCPVTIGGQTLNLQFDTGSSDFWVFSSELSAAAQAGQDLYNPAKSKTSSKVSGATWGVTYGDGSTASGDVYDDTVVVGGLAVPNQAVELASSVSSEFTSDPDCDGIFGLGFIALNNIKPIKRTNYFFTATQQGNIKRTVFTADLRKGKPGSYDFGTVDGSKFTGDITYTAVDNSRGYWGFTSSGYGIGNSPFTSTPMVGILDTGTSILLLPDAVVNAYWGGVSGAAYDNNYGAFTFPCSATLPPFTVGVGSAGYVIPGSYMNYGAVSTTSEFYICPAFIWCWFTNDNIACYGSLQSSNGIGFNIFGDVFLKAVFVIFELTGPRLGFANKVLT